MPTRRALLAAGVRFGILALSDACLTEIIGTPRIRMLARIRRCRLPCSNPASQCCLSVGRCDPSQLSLITKPFCKHGRDVQGRGRREGAVYLEGLVNLRQIASYDLAGGLGRSHRTTVPSRRMPLMATLACLSNEDVRRTLAKVGLNPKALLTSYRLDRVGVTG